MGPQGLSDIKDPKAISEIINYANSSVQELQARGVQPHIIALVEKHRDQLKSTLETQRTFAQGIQNATPQGQPRNVSNPAMNNGNPMLHPQAGMNMTSTMNGVGRPPMQPGQPPQPVNMPSTSTMAPNGQTQQQRQGGGSLIPIPATGRPTQAQTMAAIELVRRLKEENKRKSGTASAPACTNLVAQTLVSPMLVHFKFLMRRGWSTTFSLSDCIAWSRPSTRSCSTSRSV